MRLTFLALVCWATVATRAAEPTPAARLAGAFQAVDGDTARACGSIAGHIWESDHPDGRGTGTLECDLPALPATLDLDLNGFTDNEALRVTLQRPNDMNQIKLGLRSSPGPRWVRYRWSLPAAWVGRPALLVAEDNSRDLWLGVGLPASATPVRAADRRAALSSLGAILLTVLPFFSALVFLRPRFGHDEPLHLALALAGAGLYGGAVFFGYYLSHAVGLVLSAGSLVAAVVAGHRFIRRGGHCGERFMPLLAVLALAGLMIATLYLYGGSQSPEGVPAGRHDLNLPVDNNIPALFAEKIYRQEPLHPFLADWLTSDRPPLQSGLLLISRPFLPDPAARVAAAVACQLAAYAGLWALLTALGLAHRTARLCLFACVTSGFFLVNTLYAWPKLLPAGFLLAAAGLLFRIGRERRRASGPEVIALGACAALAMLGHGGSFFGLLGLGVVHLLRGGGRDRRLIAGGGAVALLLFAPWVAYQHWADPPGDRLLKYHLAGRTAVDPRGALAVMREAYEQLPLTTILANKWSNFRVLAGDFSALPANLGTAVVELATGRWREARWRATTSLQAGAFFHLLQSLDFLVIGLPFLWLARRQQPAAGANYCVQVTAATVVGWCLLMFGPEATVVHQGTYVTGALLHVAAVLGLVLSGRPRLVRNVVLLHLALWLGVWVISPGWDARHEVLRPAASWFWGIGWILCALALVWTGSRLRVGVPDDPPAGTV